MVSSTQSSSSSSSDDSITNLLTGKLEIPIKDAIKVHGTSNVKFVDGTWWLGTGMNPKGTTNRHDYEHGPRISGAYFLDIDDIADTTTKLNLPHMMPSAKLMSAAMDAMKIKSNDHIIVYVQEKCPFVHRPWFQFGCMGHSWELVHVLQGSLQDWIDSNGPIDIEPIQSVHASQLDTNATGTLYQATEPRNVISMEQIRQIVDSGDNNNNAGPDDKKLIVIVDARSPDRFYGRVDEPRPGLLRGHIPTSKNVFFMELLDKTNVSRLQSPEVLGSIFSAASIHVNCATTATDTKDDTSNNNPISTIQHSTSRDTKIITSCGSGATACTIAAALYRLGVDMNNVLLYDGSWIEWGNPANNNPISL